MLYRLVSAADPGVKSSPKLTPGKQKAPAQLNKSAPELCNHYDGKLVNSLPTQ
jgi:hypothetical protein